MEYTAVGTGDRCCVFINKPGLQIGKSADFITGDSRFTVQKSYIFFIYNDCFDGLVCVIKFQMIFITQNIIERTIAEIVFFNPFTEIVKPLSRPLLLTVH